MFSEYFGFSDEPFGATPDPRCLFDSATHREALASLRVAYFSNRGFTALIAPPGMGKTTLLLQFLHDIRSCARSVFVFETQCDPPGLLRYILRDLGIAPARDGDEMHEQLKGVVLREARAGRRLVVVVDEAQNLSDEALEMLRLLTNFETPQGKLMQIVLAGQPLLADKLMKHSLEQLRQRLSTICFLEPFSAEETAAYIRYRLEQAGYRGAPLFGTDALTSIAAASQGVPRIINTLCFNTLSLCCALKRKQVDGSMVTEAVADQELIRQPRKTDTILREVGAAPRGEPATSIATVSKRLLSAAAVLVVAAGIGLLSHFAHWPSWNRLPGQALPVVAPSQAKLSQPEASKPVNTSAPAEPTPGLIPVRVTIEANQTLHDIAVRYLGTWDLKRLHQIEALNPNLTNIDHIEANQKIWLPPPDSALAQPSLQTHAGGQP
jgi:general secretion pathway protein A